MTPKEKHKTIRVYDWDTKRYVDPCKESIESIRLKKAERKQIEEMLAPIVETWLNHKLKTVQHLFEENITGGIFRCARTNIADAGQLISEIKHLMVICEGS